MSQRGQSTLYAILLMPVLLMTLSLVADVGALQVWRVQLRWAAEWTEQGPDFGCVSRARADDRRGHNEQRHNRPTLVQRAAHYGRFSSGAIP